MRTRLRTVVAVAATWVPFGALYVFAAARYGNRPLGEAVGIAALPTFTAMLLGYVAWWFSGRLPWPSPMRARFYLGHLALGSALALAWTVGTYVTDVMGRGASLGALLRSSRTFGWQVLLGIWMYGVVAGVSYTLRARDQVQAQRAVAARAEELAARLQLDALRTRLQPHFLYNALHSLSTLVRRDQGAAERSIERLGDLLRYSLDERRGELATLGEEWAFTHDYLEIERLRLSERLELRTELSEDALACSIPAFTVQPLVENALRHGVADGAVEVILTIRAAVVAEELVIVIADNGPGAIASELDSASGLGLRALRQQLAAGGGSLELRTAPGAGFIVEVRYPQDEPA